MSGTLDGWTGTSGSWSNSGDWQNGLPNAGSLASFGGTLPETITFATTATIDGLSGTDAAAALDINSGALTIGTGGGWNGTLLLAGGALTLNAGVLTLNGTVTERPGGSATILGGATLNLEGGGALNGSIGGAGTLLLGGGRAYTIGSAKALAAGTVEIADNGGTVALGVAATVGGSFVLDGGDMSLGGKTLTLGGGGYLDGTMSGPGEVAVTKAVTIGYLTVAGGATLQDSGTLLESGNLQLGAGTADGATLAIAAGATYDLVNDVGIGANGSASIVNAGVFEKSGGAGNSYIAAGLDSTGKLIVAEGFVELEGTNDTIGGSVSGAGTLEVLEGTLDLNTAAITVGGFGAYDYATVLNLGASPILTGSFELDGATLDLDGKKLTLKGGDYLRGLIAGPGSVTVAGSGDLGFLTLSGGATLADTRLLTADGPLTLGTGTADSATVTIGAGAIFDLLNNSNSNIGAAGTASIANSGLFEMTGAGGTSTVYADMTSTGKLEAAAGNTLQLGGASNALSGSLLGGGEIDLINGGTFGIAAGTTLSVAALGIFGNGTTAKLAGSTTYSGKLMLSGGTIDYAAVGALTLTGSADLGGTLAGPVVATAKGAVQTGGLTLTGGATLVDTAVATQNGNATLGTGTADSATLQVNAGATYDIASDNTIYASGTASIANAGLFEKTAATGTSVVHADIDSTGTILDATGTLALEGAADTIGGAGLQGAGEIDLRSGGTFAIGAGVPLGVATLGIYDGGTTVTLAANESYAGTFDLGGGATLDLAGHTLAVDGASLDGVISGGIVVADATAETGGLVLTGGATLAVADVAVLDNTTVTLGTGTADSATLQVGAGDTYDIRTDNSINASGTAVIDNAGLFEKTGFTGTSTVYADLDSTGTLAVNEGTLSLNGSANTLGGSVSGSGELNLRDGSATTLAAGVTLSVGTLDILDPDSVVTLAGNILYKGEFTLGNYATLLLNGRHFTETGTGLLQGGIDGAGEFIVGASSDAQYVLLTAGATLDVTGTLTQDHFITLGTGTADSATLNVAAGGTYDLISDDVINAAGTATIVNAGTFKKTQTDGTSTVEAAVVNAKLIAANLGTIAFDGTLTNDGTITATGASVLVNDALSEASGDQGVFDIGKNGLVAIGGTVGVDASQTFAFTGTGGTLRIDDPAAFAGSITGFASGDTIDLGSIAANGLTYSNGDLIVTETQNGTLDATYTLSAPGIANSGALALINDNAGGTAIVLNHAGPAFTNPSGSIITDYWTNDASGIWSDGSNWYQVVPAPPPIYSETLHVQPNAGNDASFVPSGTADFDIAYNETDTVNNLGGATQATLNVAGGTLTINQGGDWGGGFNITAGTLDAVTGWAEYGPSSLGAAATDEVDAGTFAIAGGTLAGTVDGQGQFYLEGGNNFTIDPGFTITSGAFDLGVNGDGFGSNTTLDANLKYAGTFILTDYSGNSANLFLNGRTLTLSGSTGYLNGYVSGTGALDITGTDEIGQLTVNNSATVMLSGMVAQDGLLTIGSGNSPDATTVNITRTGTWDYVNNSGINGYGNSTIDNAGLIEKTGGTGASYFGGAVFIDTGSIVVDTGGIDIGATSNTIEGAISGPGEVYFDGGPSFTLEAGTTITTSVWDLGVNGDGFGSNTTLDTSLKYAGNFILTDYSGNSANLFLNGQTLTLSGSSYLNGYLSGTGVLDITGTADIPGLTVNNSATVNITGTVTQDGLLELGTGTTPDATTINIAAGGTYDILDDAGMNVYGATTIANAGLFEKTGGVGVSGLYYGGTFTNTGTVAIATGWIDFGGTNNLGGTITGAGNLGLLVGTSTLDAGAKITVANMALLLNGDGFGASLTLGENFSYGGSFESYDYSGNATFLNLNGFNATFSGSSFWNGQLNGAGTLALSGTATIAGQGVSGAVMDVTGTADSVGNLYMDSGATLEIGKLGVFDMLNDGNAETNAGILGNTGLIEKTAGAGTSYLQGDLTSTGTIDAVTGMIEFQNAANSTIGGKVTGAGTVWFVSGGNYTIDAGTKLTVANLGLYGNILFDGNLAYAHSFDFGGGTLDLNGHTVTLSGPDTLDGTIEGGGTLTIAKKTIATTTGLTLAGATVVNDAGTLVSDGTMAFGTTASDAPTLDIAATGVLDLNSDNYSSFGGTPVLVNAGLIEKTGITATSSLNASLTNTGRILVTQGVLVVQTPVASTIGGTVEGTGTLVLQGGSSTLAPGVALKIAGFSLAGSTTNVLNLSLAYAGDYTLNGATENLHGDTLTLSGIANLSNGTMTGPGVLDTTGTAAIGYLTIDGGATLDNSGALTETGNVTQGDATGPGTAINAAGATWNFIGDGGVFTGGSIEGTFTNSGLLEKTAGTGVSNISANFSNAAGATIDVATGTIAIGSGTAAFGGTVEGAGSLAVSAFATISSLSVTGGNPNFAGGLTVSGTLVDTGATLFVGGTLTGAGTIDVASQGLAQIDGTAAAGTTVAFVDATGTLALANPAGFGATIAGMVAGDTIDLLNTPASAVTGLTFGAHTLTIDVAGGTSYALHMLGSYTSSSFHVAADGHNGAAITV